MEHAAPQGSSWALQSQRRGWPTVIWGALGLATVLGGFAPASADGEVVVRPEDREPMEAEPRDSDLRDSDRAAVDAIRRLGGSVRRVRDGGEDREVEFHLRGRAVTDRDLVHVGSLRDVAVLNLRDTKVTGAGLVHLKDLVQLRKLHLERTLVADKGMENLRHLKHLEYLNLYGTKITDDALEHIAHLKSLERLYLWQTEVTDEGVARLQARLPELRVVRGVDLSRLPDYVDEELDVPEPKEDLGWIPVADAKLVPKSETGVNTQVFFENRSGTPVRLYWVSYGAELKLYAELAPGAIRQQNTYSRNTWLITDQRDRVFGYFVVGAEVARAVIPKLKEAE